MNTRSDWNLRIALVIFLSACLIPAAVAQVAPAPTPPPPAEDEPLKLEEFTVTGTRIKRLDVETPAPVVAYTAADIETKGYPNIGAFFQSLPFNTGSIISSNQVIGSQAFGATIANPRGLGSNRFLVLIDGRRTATYAIPTLGNRQVFDFNSLPVAALESVEFLKDGASAIYGADAITGVFNIKLKKNFNGLSTTAYYGNTLKHDTGLMQFSVLAGAGAGKTRGMVAFDVKRSNSNFLRDYGVTTTDYTIRMGPNKGANLLSTLNWPANIVITAAQATAIGIAPGNYVVSGGRLLSTPTRGDFAMVTVIPSENRYNFVETFQLYPAYDHMSAYAQMEHEFNENISAFGTAVFSDNRTYFSWTPTAIVFLGQGLTLPAHNPFNPFGIALNTLLARAQFGPVRKFDTGSISGNFVGGLRGTYNQWDWETAASYGFNQVTTVTSGAIRETTYQAALNGTLPGFVGQFFNPFGPSPPGVQAALFTTSTGMNKGEGVAWDASITNSALFTLPGPGGDVGIAAGVELRNDMLQTNPDTSAFIGIGRNLPLRGERDVMSAYVEVNAPIIDRMLEVQLAVRHEDYSDFGESTNPKYAAKFRFPENRIANVILRASYSESFQAPALALLHSSQTIGFTPTILADPLRPGDAPQQLRLVTGGNPDLLPELGETIYTGIVVEVPAVKDLSFSLDYFKFRINQVIVTPGPVFLLSARGLAQFPRAIVRDGPGGPIMRIESIPSNNPLAFQLYRGLDLGVNYRLSNTRLGDFAFTADLTRTLEIGSDSGLGGGYIDTIGRYNTPKWRGNASVGWHLRNLSASVSADYIGAYFNDNFTPLGWGENPYTLVHTSVSHRGFWGTTITVGANNVLDNRPPDNGRAFEGFDPFTYGAGAMGRFLYVRVRKDF